MPSLSEIIPWLIHYKYLIIFPIAIVEGPIISIIAGFLAHNGQLNFFGAFSVVALADLVGDTIYYSIGRFGRERFLRRFGKFLRLDTDRITKLEKHYETHPWKTFTFGKFVHGTGSLILVASGLGNVPYFKFLGYNIPTTLINSLLMVTIGFYFGQAYESFNTYFEYVAGAALLVVVGLYIYFIKKTKNSID